MQRLVDHLAAAARVAAECADGPGQTAARLLRVILDAAGVPCGALLAYHPARIRLVLAASRLDETCRDALVDLGVMPELAIELLTALRTGDPVLARAGMPLHRALCVPEESDAAALFVPLRAYREPIGMLVLLGPTSRLADGTLSTLADGVDLLAHLVPRDMGTDGGSVLVDVEPVTTIATTAVGGRVHIIDEMVVLDGASVGGRHVLVELPDHGAARRLATIDGPIYVNLAVPRAAEVIAAMRAEGGMQPVQGYLATGGGGHATMLGRVEVTHAPFDPDEVAGAVGRLAPGTGAVLVVGSDSGAVLALRQALARRRTAVRLVWDRPSAHEALAGGDVDVVVVDLGLPDTDGHRLVVEAVRSPSRPSLVIVPGAAAVADGFSVLFAQDYPPLSESPPIDEMLERAVVTSG